MALQCGRVRRFSGHLDEEGAWSAAGFDHCLEYGTAAWPIADHLETDVVARHWMIKNAVLVEQSSQRVGHGRTLQARQIGVVRVEPDRDLTLSITEDHGTFVVAAASSGASAGTEQFGAASSGPVNGCRVGGGRRVPWIGVNVIKPP